MTEAAQDRADVKLEIPVGFDRWSTPTDVLEALRDRFAPLAAWATRAHADGDPECQRVARGILELEADVEAATARVRDLS